MNVRCAAVALLALTPGLAACSNASFATPAVPAGASAPNSRPDSSSPIKHVVILIQENRSFDNFFATFPGANGTTTGYYLKKVNGKYVRTQVPLTETTLGSLDFNHSWKDYIGDYDNGGMDGFNHEGYNGNNPAGLQPYQYVNPSQIQQYWTLAQQYALADEMFQTQGSGSFTAHQDLIAGTTHQVYNNHIGSLIDYPSGNGNWGCNAPSQTVTTVLTKTGQYLQGEGPFPCLTYSTGTLRDKLDAKHVSWKYYAPPHKNNTVGALWNAFAAIDAVYNGPEWATNISMPETNIFNDITNSQLAGGFMGHSRPSRFRSSALEDGQVHRPGVGRLGRQRSRTKQLLELDRHHRRLGRLGRLLRPRCAAVLRQRRRPRIPRADARHLAVRSGRHHRAHAVRVRQHLEVRRADVRPRLAGNDRRARDLDR